MITVSSSSSVKTIYCTWKVMANIRNLKCVRHVTSMNWRENWFNKQLQICGVLNTRWCVVNNRSVKLFLYLNRYFYLNKTRLNVPMRHFWTSFIRKSFSKRINKGSGRFWIEEIFGFASEKKDKSVISVETLIFCWPVGSRFTSAGLSYHWWPNVYNSD